MKKLILATITLATINAHAGNVALTQTTTLLLKGINSSELINRFWEKRECEADASHPGSNPVCTITLDWNDTQDLRTSKKNIELSCTRTKNKPDTCSLIMTQK